MYRIQSKTRHVMAFVLALPSKYRAALRHLLNAYKMNVNGREISKKTPGESKGLEYP
jgi:hypothetical protein